MTRCVACCRIFAPRGVGETKVGGWFRKQLAGMAAIDV